MATILEPKRDEVETWDVPRTLRRFTAEEYLKLCEAGILDEDERVELLEGCVVSMMTRMPPHDVALRLVAKALDRILPSGFDLRVQSAVALSGSMPEPDCAIVVGDIRRYRDHHPAPGEIELVIEVSDSSLQLDRTWKSRIYGRDQVPCYWIVNLPDRTLEICTDPTGDVPDAGYRVRQVLTEQDSVTFVVGGKDVGVIAVADLLP